MAERMNLNKLLNLKTRNNPDSLLNLLVGSAFISIVIIIILSSYGFYRVFSSFVIKSAEIDSVQLCRVLIEEQKELMFVKPAWKPFELGVQAANISFDLRLRQFLAPFNIIKVKIYNTDKRIVYSTDPQLIGKVDENNLRLKKALSGAVDAKMVTKDKASDLTDEPLRDVDVVETYMPILSPDNKILGSFEVYMNMTGYREQIRKGVVLASSLLSLVLGAVFGVSYLLIHGGTGQLKEAQSRLEEVAITDPLTGIHNRGYLMRRGEEEFERVRRYSRPLGCIMLDLDHFKRVNDSRGHVAGDSVLSGVANRLRHSLRPYDIVGRYGGEEFMLLLPDTSFEQIVVVANRICELIRSAPFEVDEELVPVTISLGVSCYNKADRTLNDIIKRADEGLYKAKADGRNRVAWIYQPGASETAS
jgi:diguanylate cyclase (GGDEF)-like protein